MTEGAGEHPEWGRFKKANSAGKFAGQFSDWLAMPQSDRDELSGLSTPEALVTVRKDQHGDWLQQSKMGFKLKETMRSGKNYSTLEPHQREALDMIQTKVSRILTGDAAFADHWDDIAGYALLGKGGHP